MQKKIIMNITANRLSKNFLLAQLKCLNDFKMKIQKRLPNETISTKMCLDMLEEDLKSLKTRIQSLNKKNKWNM